MASGRRNALDTLFTTLLKHRKCLTELDARKTIPRFDETQVCLSRCPVGAWSTPIIDVYVIIKAVLGFESKRILELGSYRGDTARLIAENTADDTRLCTVDVHPEHGASYKNSPVARRIERKIGEIRRELFTPEERYDFIFVDANHDFNSVANDTLVALDLLSDHGVIFWHDYSFGGYFHGMAGVPDALKIFSKDLAICAVLGTNLAFHSRHPGWETKRLIGKHQGPDKPSDVWQETTVRG